MSIFQDVIDFLESRDHVMEVIYAAGNVHAVTSENGRIYANSDFRKSGSIDGFWEKGTSFWQLDWK